MIVRGDPDSPERVWCVTVWGGRDGGGVVAVEGASEEPQHRGPLVRRERQVVDGGDRAVIRGLVGPRRGGVLWRAREAPGRNERGGNVHRGEACADPCCVMSRPDVRTLSSMSRARNEHDCCIVSICCEVGFGEGFGCARRARSLTGPRSGLCGPRTTPGLDFSYGAAQAIGRRWFIL